MNTFFKDTIALLKRPVVAVGIIVVLCLVLCGAYSIEGKYGPLHSVQNAVINLFMPVSGLGNSAKSGLMSISDYLETQISGDTIDSIKSENAQLKAKVAAMEKYKEEAERLQKLINLKNQYKVEGKAAHVIGSSSTAWSQTITINIGENDDINAGQTVLGSSGVVGEVVSTTAENATVRLITDPNSGVAVSVQKRNTECILTGSLDGVLSLDGIDSNVDVQVGDIVVTSGLGGSYIKGLTVGTVSQVVKNTSGAGNRVIVSPSEQLDNIQEVFVINKDE